MHLLKIKLFLFIYNLCIIKSMIISEIEGKVFLASFHFNKCFIYLFTS